MINRLRFPRSEHVGRLGVACVLLSLGLPTGVGGQGPASEDSASTSVGVHQGPWQPDLRARREVAVLGLGAGFLGASLLVHVDVRDVPSQGFDPSGIPWTMDRDIVGNRSLHASARSNWSRNAAILFPFALALASGPPEERWLGFGRGSLMRAETFLVSQGLTHLGKVTLGRARPYAYLSSAERPEDSTYDVSRERTFYSMPSGHSASAWTGAALGMTEHLLRRPDATWLERAGIGFLGGTMAATTAALRVEAGQHFPSDVLAGAGIGIVTGVAIPLLHRGRHALPSRGAWLQMVGGALIGTVSGVVIAYGLR